MTEPSDGAVSESAPSPAADEVDDFGPPFSSKTFGGAFVWARGDKFVATVLRIREGQNVAISTRNRTDMTVLLTGGRAVLESEGADGTDRVELLPATPVVVDDSRSHRLLALTEVEIFTVYAPNPATA